MERKISHHNHLLVLSGALLEGDSKFSHHCICHSSCMPTLNTPFLASKTHWSHSAWIWACLFLAMTENRKEGERKGALGLQYWQSRYEQTAQRPNALHDKDREIFPLKTQIILAAKESGWTNGNGLDWDCWCSFCCLLFLWSAPAAWTSKSCQSIPDCLRLVVCLR